MPRSSKCVDLTTTNLSSLGCCVNRVGGVAIHDQVLGGFRLRIVQGARSLIQCQEAGEWGVYFLRCKREEKPGEPLAWSPWGGIFQWI